MRKCFHGKNKTPIFVSSINNELTLSDMTAGKVELKKHVIMEKKEKYYTAKDFKPLRPRKEITAEANDTDRTAAVILARKTMCYSVDKEGRMSFASCTGADYMVDMMNAVLDRVPAEELVFTSNDLDVYLHMRFDRFIELAAGTFASEPEKMYSWLLIHFKNQDESMYERFSRTFFRRAGINGKSMYEYGKI